MTPANVIDIILIAILALGLIIGLARGLMNTLLGVVIFVLAIVGSAWIANAAAQPITDWAVPYVEQFLVEEVTASFIEPQTASLSEDLLGEFGGLVQQMIDSAVTEGMAALSGTLDSIVHTIAYVILFLLSMLVLTWLLRLITIPLRLVDRVPVLGLANRLSGAVLGLIMGVAICFIVALVVKLTGFIDPADTYLYSFFAANTPASLLALLR